MAGLRGGSESTSYPSVATYNASLLGRPLLALRFHRIVKTDPPTRDDFLSLAELGRKPQPDATDEERASFNAVSMNSTLDGARAKAKKFKKLGRYISAVDLPEGAHITWKQTGLDPTHYDIHGSTADELVSLVNPPTENA